MDPVEGNGARSPLQAAREPLSLRFLLAFSASTVLTAAVAVPMAYQAHLAREEQDRPQIERRPSVLGTTTVPGPADVSPADGLFVRDAATGESRPLGGAELTGAFELFLELPGVARVDFVLDDGPVITDRAVPWQPFAPESGPPQQIAEGEHVLRATVTFDNGRVEARWATFDVVAG